MGACKHDPPTPAAVQTPPSAASPAPTAPASVPRPRASAAASASASARILRPEEAKAYQQALGRGRLATKAHQWTAAIAAFDGALAVIPDDPRAHSERGYASLLSNDLDGAEKDFRAAEGRQSDKKLEAQIYFNLGLVAEGKGQEEAARLAFARSFALNPLVASRDKLSGKSSCVVGVDRTPKTPRHFATWVAAWQALKDSSDAQLTDEGAARKAFGIADCATSCVSGPDYSTGCNYPNYHLFLPRADGSLDVFENAAQQDQGRCTPPAFVEVKAGAQVHLVVANTLIEIGYGCANEGTPEQECRTFCSNHCTWYRNDVFFDATTHARVLAVSQTGACDGDGTHRGGGEIQVEESGVVVEGAGCSDKRIPFKAP